MKKKNIIQIIIGFILIIGVGYAIYSEIERKKEDYFVIKTKLEKEKIAEVLKEKEVEKIHEWSSEIKKTNYNFVKIKAKIKVYEELKNEKKLTIEYVDQTGDGGCVRTHEEDQCSIWISDADAEERGDILIYLKRDSLDGASYTKKALQQIKKHPKVESIKFYKYVVPEVEVGKAL